MALALMSVDRKIGDESQRHRIGQIKDSDERYLPTGAGKSDRVKATRLPSHPTVLISE